LSACGSANVWRILGTTCGSLAVDPPMVRLRAKVLPGRQDLLWFADPGLIWQRPVAKLPHQWFRKAIGPLVVAQLKNAKTCSNRRGCGLPIAQRAVAQLRRTAIWPRAVAKLVNVRPSETACQRWWLGVVCQPQVQSYECSSNNSSRHKDSVKFLKQCRQLVAEELIGFAESTLLTKRRIIKVVGFNAETGGDVVADEI
jgi:hypothetical protein